MLQAAYKEDIEYERSGLLWQWQALLPTKSKMAGRLPQSFHLLRRLRSVLMLRSWLMRRTMMSMRGLVSLCRWGTLLQTTRRRCWRAWAARRSLPPRACPPQMRVRHLPRASRLGRAQQEQVGHL